MSLSSEQPQPLRFGAIGAEDGTVIPLSSVQHYSTLVDHMRRTFSVRASTVGDNFTVVTCSSREEASAAMAKLIEDLYGPVYRVAPSEGVKPSVITVEPTPEASRVLTDRLPSGYQPGTVPTWPVVSVRPKE